MKKTMISTAAVFLFFLLSAGQIYPCSSIVTGRKATKDGSVLFGHNEDDFGRRVVNVWHVGRMSHPAGTMITLLRGGQIPQVEETWAFTWFQVNDLEFSDYFVNEWGVHIASDACGSREDDPQLKDGGIGYLLRRIVAERATTARQGVMIAGKLLDEFGYAQSGRGYIICDNKEAWILHTVAGKHWVAQRVPDGEVAFLPNQYIIRTVDFSDTDNFYSSADNIKDYAIEKGWYDPKSGKPFDFASAYMPKPRQQSKLARRGYDTRQWRAQALMTGKPVSVEEALKDGLPFSVKPNRKLAVADFQAVLRDHYEGTEYAPVERVSAVMPPTSQPDEKSQGAVPVNIAINPNQTTERTICTMSTVFSFVVQIRADMPVEIGSVTWMSFGRPDVNVYIPWYTGMTTIPSQFNNTLGVEDPGQALVHNFDPLPGTFRFDEESAFWVFNELENVVDPIYFRAMRQVKPEWEQMESYLFLNQGVVEKKALELYKKDKDAATKYLTHYTQAQATESIKRARGLLATIKSFYYH